MELSQEYGTPMSLQELQYNFTPGISPTAFAAVGGGGGCEIDDIDDDDDIDDGEKTIDLFFDEMTWIQYQQQQKQRDDDLDDFIPVQQPQPQETLPAIQKEEQQQEQVSAPAMNQNEEQDVAAADQDVAAAEQDVADAASLRRLFMQSVADAKAQENDAYPLSIQLPNGFIVSFGMVPAHRIPQLLQQINCGNCKSNISLQ
jgi:hypothetical protein